MAFNLATQGCSMAHCDVRMSDIANMSAPRTQGATKFHDTGTNGSNIGLGVASNGTVVAATYQGGITLKVYNFLGDPVFSSTDLNGSAWKSAPMVSVAGEVIAADDTRVIRYNSNGSIQWNRLHGSGGAPISPVLTSNSKIVLVTENGQVKVHGTIEGLQSGSLSLGFNVKNTPAVNGTKIYVVGNDGTTGFGRLRAINIPDSGNPTIDWGRDFQGTGGASPLYWNGFIYFDGKQNDSWWILRVSDNNTSVTQFTSLLVKLEASIAQDLRNDSMWFFQPAGRLKRINLNGVIIDEINDLVLGGVPASAITMAGTPASPVLLVRGGLGTNAGVVAVDLITKTRLWKSVDVINTFGQFGLLQSGTQFRVACTASNDNLYLLG